MIWYYHKMKIVFVNEITQRTTEKIKRTTEKIRRITRVPVAEKITFEMLCGSLF